MRVLLLAALLATTPAVADESSDEEAPSTEEAPAEPVPEPVPDEDPGEDPEAAPDPPPAPEPPPVPAPAPAAERTPPPHLQSTARIVASGRVSGAILVDEGRSIVAPLATVQIGWPAFVTLGEGHSTRARIVAVDHYEGLALMALDEAAPAGHAAVIRTSPPGVGEDLTIVGHGGSVGLGEGNLQLRGMLTFSPLSTKVSALEAGFGEETDLAPGERPRRFLVDRSPGEGDEGAPLFDADGRFAGLLLEAVEGGGGRGVAVDAAAVADLVAEPRLEKPYTRAHHLQSWAGIGIAAHNRPSHLGATLSYGLRGVFLDQIRIEPFIDDDGSRPRDFWWSIETGASFGWRIPMFGEGARNYIVPTLGFRAGWNRFEHKNEELVSDCGDADAASGCAFIIDRTIDQERSFRAGFDLGIDIRHGPVRVGYRFFLDPTNVNPHAMHRLLVTFDGAGIPLRAGDSN